MKHLIAFIIALFFSSAALAQGPENPFPFNAPTTGYAQNGQTVVNICCGNLALPPFGTCLNNCDTLIGAGAGALLPSGDYLTTAIGFKALGSDTLQRPENMAIGWNAAGNGDGASFTFLTAVGINALGGCLTNCNNDVIIGGDAAATVTSLNQTVLIGVAAGRNSNMTTSVGIGYSALTGSASSSTLGNNVAIGNAAMQATGATTATDDTAVGASAMTVVTSGVKDVAIGSGSLGSGTTASQDTCLGYKSCGLTTTGHDVVAVGTFALSTGIYTGQEDTILGSQAGTNLISSVDNLIAGFSAGQALTTGSNNVMLGAKSGQLVTGSNNICVGTNSCNTLTSGTGNLVIGGGTTVTATTSSEVNIRGSIVGYDVPPVIGSGFGTSPAIAGIGTFEFDITIGSGGTASTGTITMLAAPNAWSCFANDETTTSATVFMTKQTASSTTSVTLTNFAAAGTAAAWTAGDIVKVTCHAR
jgi:hypothetical protein